MSGRSLTADVLQFLEQVELNFVSRNLSDPAELATALTALWKLIGGLEATALRRASVVQRALYQEAVLYPRAQRVSQHIVELVPTPRTDKDGVPW